MSLLIENCQMRAQNIYVTVMSGLKDRTIFSGTFLASSPIFLFYLTVFKTSETETMKKV